MFTNIPFIFLAIAVLLAILWVTSAFISRKNVFPAFYKKEIPALQTNRAQATKFPPELIDRPINEINENVAITAEKEIPANLKLESVDDQETILLKAAEIVVEKIQDVVTHVASNPPNPEEVFSKIRAIVRDYRLFENTEYFDAINSFIAITVERDCGIQFSKDQLMQLWDY